MRYGETAREAEVSLADEQDVLVFAEWDGVFLRGLDSWFRRFCVCSGLSGFLDFLCAAGFAGGAGAGAGFCGGFGCFGNFAVVCGDFAVAVAF